MTQELLRSRGEELVDRDGGKIEEIYLDADTDDGIATGGNP